MREASFYSSMLDNMTEGIMAIDKHGRIIMANRRCSEILGIGQDELLNQIFLGVFLEKEENEELVQAIIDAIYDKYRTHKRVVTYIRNNVERVLYICTSFLFEEDEKMGISVIMSDITELENLRDAVKATKKIQALNKQLEIRNDLLRTTFGRYLSDDIVETILEGRNGLKMGGKKKDLTVMMSDLRGFSLLSDLLKAEELFKVLEYYFDKMLESIQAYHGSVLEYMGDGMLVVFGAFHSIEDHAAQAVACAIAMQKSMRDVKKWCARHGYPEIQMGIGIHTGEMLIGNIGSSMRTKFGVLGKNVNIAGRIESFTVGDQILISKDTRDEIQTELLADEEMDVEVKGDENKVHLYSVYKIGEPYSEEYEKNNSFDDIVELAREPEIHWKKVKSKIVMDHVYNGRLLGISERGAIFRPENPIRRHDNLVLDVGFEIYAKCVKKEEDRVYLTFTFCPPAFRSWLKDICEKGKE